MRIALGVEYNGKEFVGWQYQENLRTVQNELESAIAKVADQPILTICAGRTDKGVHAVNQVVHFDTEVLRNKRAWLLGVNSNLPRDIAVHWVEFMDSEFHARFSAIQRHYRYLIFNNPVRSALLTDYTAWYLPKLDLIAMQRALDLLLGEHDFSSFRGPDCQAKSPIKTIYKAHISVNGSIISVDICANAFLHHMVRNIVGVLFKIGEGKAAPEWITELLALKNRSKAAITAPAEGLYLMKINYPPPIKLPENALVNSFCKL